ncbi:10843_t:CDS:2, partial [Gigaspora rosea]
MLLEESKIRESIEERCDRIVTNQKLMLNSSLERPTKKIKINRVYEDVGDDFKLYTKEKKFSTEWKYILKNNLEKEILIEITLEEWEQLLSTTRSNSASGMSGITYPVLRQIRKYTMRFCIEFLSKCLASSKIPQKWKLGLLYPILKKEEWNFNLNN